MRENFSILVADRNPHVREFLRRELMKEGYKVKLAMDGRSVLRIIDSDEPSDLLILDPDIPYADGLQILEQLQKRMTHLPVVLHTFLTEYANQPAIHKAAAFLEKTGNNIDHLKSVVDDLLRKLYPQRFTPTDKNKEKKRGSDTSVMS